MRKPKSFEYELRQFVKVKLRRASLMWKPRNLALKAARVDRGLYQCEMCKDIFPRQNVQLDHKAPVMDIRAPDFTFDNFVRRLFVDVSGFAVLCINCHLIKSTLEAGVRSINKKKKLAKIKKTT